MKPSLLLRSFHLVYLLFLAHFFIACTNSRGIPEPHRYSDANFSTLAKENPHVIFIGVDGIGSHNLWPDTKNGIESPSIPNLEQLLKDSAYSKTAQIDRRNWSGPNWAGMLTGKDSDVHNVTSNECLKSTVPTVFDTIADKKPELEAGMVVNWKKLACYSNENSADFVHTVDGGTKDVMMKTLEVIDNKLPNFMFLYFGDVDSAGHDFGAKSEQYKDAIEEVDAAVGNVIAKLRRKNLYDSTDIILSSDHGHDTEKSGHSSTDFPVPFLLKSSHVKTGIIGQDIANRAAAPSILWLLGINKTIPF